ncbi:hypothetical protein F5B22DRAFT_390040 [Xylaria bambusicola]|uniref:uncharacterized protein n=1 Tax=Xylaria bambusicola TaxID=326684 RepID=UPI002007696D|nr:uncharacterized protein F5B22DRAFT_390040 [Xylaria bambusicola]KAI0508522.1 hypothetical protein F5B22DRAFT_390040 [Xylaria bambusicola]
MASVKVLKTLTMGKGITLSLLKNEDAAEDSIDRYVAEVVATGEEPIKIPPHWHKEHAEQMTIIEGRVKITLDGVERIVNAGDPPVLIERRVVHSIEGFKGEKFVGQERPVPGGNYKIMFFNDMLHKGTSPGFWYLMRVFYDGDGYIALPLHFRFLDEMFMKLFGGIAHLFAAPRPTEL